MMIFRSLIAAAGLALAAAPVAAQAQSESPAPLRTSDVSRPFDQPHVLFPFAPPIAFNNASDKYKPIVRYWRAKPTPPRHGGPIRSHGAR